MPKTPRGVTMLLIRAAVDEDFCRQLLQNNAGAASSIGLVLTPSEREMLAAVSDVTLRGMIGAIRVPDRLREPIRSGTLVELEQAAFALDAPDPSRFPTVSRGMNVR